MSVAPHSGIVDFGTFTPPAAPLDGIQGEVPAPLVGESGYVLSASGWVAGGSIPGLGTMATQNADNVAITGGSINGTAIGASSPSTGIFTTLIGGGGSANYAQITGGATTKAVQFQTLGTDTNISQVFRSKGTGAIDLAAGSSGVNISNGGTVTAITRTAAGSGYTSLPTITITPPTTAGGVQATASPAMFVSTAPVASGGSGYTVGDTLTVSGGTASLVATLTVATLSGSAIATVTVANGGSYTALPTNPVSVTGGTGTGATFNLTWGLASAFTITNAGSGYVEQPTVTFSGGGGSGAAAYATVGSNTVQKSIGNIHTFATPNSNVLAIVDKNTSGGYPTNSTVAFSMIPIQSGFGASYLGFGSAAYLGTASSATSGAFIFATSVSSPVSNGVGGSSQFQIGHTASAVNYVQVTGSATSPNAASIPSISTQGSDTTTYLGVGVKGASGYVAFFNSTLGSSSQAFRIVMTGTANTGNLLQVQGAAAGSGPTLSAISGPSGTDTDIALNLTTKGTGAVNFNTGTTSALQFQVADTASAVNYAQATGAITANRPRINFTGSDTNVGGTFITKGSGTILFASDANAGTIQFGVLRTASSVNYIAAAGAATTASPSFTSTGSDANIDLSLTPKGTGLVRFGTYTAGALTATGYINIKAADGTTYKLLVST